MAPADIYVVVDTMGASRIVGVFDSEAAAIAVVGDFPEYYEIHRCPLNQVSPEAIDWARTDEQRAHLRRVADKPRR